MSTYDGKISIKSKTSGKERNISEKGGLTKITFPFWHAVAQQLVFGKCKYEVSAIENAIKKI